MTIRDIIIKYTDEFADISDSPRLDVCVIKAYII